MNAPTVIQTPDSLPSLVRTAAQKLAKAETAAEVLDARLSANAAYDAAKSAARIAKAKSAHDEIISAVYRAQADALEIESAAKRRLADEYDAAQERGEVRTVGNVPDQNNIPTAADVGLSRKDIHEARQIRNAELADPGIVRRTLDSLVEAGSEPNKARLREAVIEAAREGLAPEKSNRRNPEYVDDPAYRMMLKILGPCRSMAEAAEGGAFDIVTIERGFLDNGHRARAIRDIAKARDFLTDLLEVLNAH